jgi:peptidoglycan hydrolase CwlO-like protein
MNRRTLAFFAATIFVITIVAFTPTIASAQNDSAAPAQTPGQTSSPAPAPQTPAKKVWTNDDIHSANPTSSDPNYKSAGATAKPKPSAKGKDASWYRGQISKLQAQIPTLDEKISQLQAALNGQTVNSTRQYGGVRPDDWRDELSRFQKQRDDIDTKIAALQDQARHDGVPENELP